MDIGIALSDLNWLAVVVAAVSTFVLGALWYGPLLGKRWAGFTGVTPEKAQESSMALIFGSAFVLQLIAATALGLFIGPGMGAYDGSFAGFMTGAFFVATGLGVVYLFERRPPGLWVIDAGYQIVAFTLMGLILGIW